MKQCATALSVLLLSAFQLVAAPGFKGDVTVQKKGKGAVIRFELSEFSDVAVYIEDGKGKIVRHLAAGVLKENAPEPFKSGFLKQSIAWDGKDDSGQPAGEGPFKVRVAAGIKASHAGTAFGSLERGDTVRDVVGLGMGRDGQVYAMCYRWKRAWWTHTSIHAFKRTGEYDKTIKPFPADISAERVKGFTQIEEHDRPLPVVYRVLSMSYYPNEDIPQHMAVTSDGNLHFAVNTAAYRKPATKWLASLSPDGGLPYEKYTGAKMPSSTSAGDVHLAASSDDKFIFATGLERGPGKSSKSRPNTPIVYKIGLPERKTAVKLFGDPKATGSDKSHLKDPRGLAIDGKGQLLIADRGNNRVVIIKESGGAYVTAFPVPGPTWVGVHRRSGAIYVQSKGEIIKYLREGDEFKQKSRLRLPVLTKKMQGRVRWSFALDAEADSPILWVGMSGGGPALQRTVEKDGKFAALKQAGYQRPLTFWNICTGQDGKTVACKVGHYGLRVLDEDTGKTRDHRLTGSAGQTYRIGPNGQFYGMDHWKWAIRRWDKNGKYLPYPTTKDHKEIKGRLPSQPTGTTSWERDFDVDRQGNVYVKQRGKVYHGRMRVDKFDKDGNFLKTVIWVVSDGAHGPRVDPAGNVYIAETIRPVGKRVPDFFKDKLPKVKIDKRGSVDQQYLWMYGSIIKFTQKGGAVWFPIIDPKRDIYGFDGKAKLPEGLPKVDIDTAQGDRSAVKPGKLEGAVWYKYGCAYILDMHPGHNRRCHCTATEFEVDDFGRSFYTDQGRFRVVILDTNGNEIMAFGQYGNQDSKAPEIGFSWFTGLGVSDRYAYVADGSNRRVLRVKLDYAATQTVDVK